MKSFITAFENPRPNSERRIRRLRSIATRSPFNATFEQPERTVLQGGADEPYYAPGEPHRIVFREDFVRSALHEVAHWCVAGERRRTLPDYGYWYSPDGRDADQQQAFLRSRRDPRR